MLSVSRLSALLLFYLLLLKRFMWVFDSPRIAAGFTLASHYVEEVKAILMSVSYGPCMCMGPTFVCFSFRYGPRPMLPLRFCLLKVYWTFIAIQGPLLWFFFYRHGYSTNAEPIAPNKQRKQSSKPPKKPKTKTGRNLNRFVFVDIVWAKTAQGFVCRSAYKTGNKDAMVVSSSVVNFFETLFKEFGSPHETRFNSRKILWLSDLHESYLALLVSHLTPSGVVFTNLLKSGEKVMGTTLEYKGLSLALKDRQFLLSGSFSDLNSRLDCPLEVSDLSFPLDLPLLSNESPKRDEVLTELNCEEKILRNVDKTLKTRLSILRQSFVDMSTLIEAEYPGVLIQGSLSRLAMDLYQSKFTPFSKEEQQPRFWNDRLKGFHHLSESTDRFVRKSYIGGLCEVYTPRLKGGYVYDVTSHYPAMMKEMDMPFDIGSRFKPTEVDLDTFFGFVQCDITTPKKIKRPFLFCDLGNDNVLAQGTFSGVFFSEEVKLARKYGYKVKVFKAYAFERRNLFSAYVEHFFNLKNSSKGYKRWFYKIILNSLYGRFGMDFSSTSLQIVPYNENKFEHRIWEYRFGALNQALMARGFIMTEVEKPRKRASKAFDTDRFVAHVGIASAITSYSRCMMYPYMIDESVVYTDTDRLFTSKKLKSVGSNLGQFRLETEFVDAIFLAPRTYILKHQDGSLTRKMAGVPHEHQSLFSFEDFESCLTKGFQVTKTYFCAKERRSFIYTLEACDDTKRRKLYDSNNVWVGTKPVLVKEGELISPK